MPHPYLPGRFDDLLASNPLARWLYAKAQDALIEAAATAKPLTKEEAGKEPFADQMEIVDRVCPSLLPLLLLHLLIQNDRRAKP